MEDLQQNNNSDQDKKHHIMSYADNLKVWIVLLFLTWFTITIAYVTGSIAIALIVATIKSGVVLAYFMHLKFESRLLTILFLVTMTVFTSFIILTFFDYALR